MRRNVEAFEELVWRPRQATYHEQIDTATEVLGTTLAMPVMTAPCGGMRLVHPEGDIGLVKAAAKFGICHIASAVSGFPLEEIAASHSAPKWFQLYRLGSRPLMESLVHRAQAAGYEAIVVTVDSVMVGYREKDYKNGFSFNMRINLENMARLAPQVIGRPRRLYHYWRDGMPFEISNTLPVEGGEALPLSAMARTDLSHSPTWDDIEWIRANWKGPMVVKGIMGAEDARRAVQAGADGIVVSNHGGRQLEGVRPRSTSCPRSSPRSARTRRSCSTPACAAPMTSPERWRWVPAPSSSDGCPSTGWRSAARPASPACSGSCNKSSCGRCGFSGSGPSTT